MRGGSRPSTPSGVRATLAGAGDGSGAGFDDLEPVPVRVLELEHGRDSRPPEQVPDLDAPLPHGGVLCFGVGNQEPESVVVPGACPGELRECGGRVGCSVLDHDYVCLTYCDMTSTV